MPTVYHVSSEFIEFLFSAGDAYLNFSPCNCLQEDTDSDEGNAPADEIVALAENLNVDG